MAQAIFYDKDAALRQGIGQAGSALGSALQYNAQEQMKQQKEMQDRQRQSGALNAVLEWQKNIPEGEDMMQHIGTLQQTLQGMDYDPKMIEPLVQNVIQTSAKNRLKKPELSPFQKKMQEKRGDFIAETVFNAPHVADSRKSIERLRELSGNLKGVEGYAKALWGSQDATEFNSLGLAAIEPVLKVFNPRGAVPQAKIEMIKNQFAPTASDNRWTIEGKLKGLESFTQNAENLQEVMNGLFQMYGEDIPMEAIMNYEALAGNMLDASLGNKGVADINQDGTPDKMVMDKPTKDMAVQNKGRIIVNQETGEKLISNGTRWVKYKG